MTSKSKKSQIYKELRKLILTSEREKLLPELKDIFRNAAIDDRGAYKHEFLKLAQEPEIGPFHGAIFETLASLEAIYQEHIPRKNLKERFDKFYEAGQYEEAGRICSDLIAQGLDYIGAVDIGKGDILPLHDEKEPKILQFNEQEIKILDLDLNLLYEVDIPQNKKIIDVLPSAENNQSESSEIDSRIWALAEDNSGSNRSVIPLTKDRKKFELQLKIEVPSELTEFNHLSRFQDHLLLVDERAIYSQKTDPGWEKWLTTEDIITCFKHVEDYYWFGIASGHVRIIKKFEQGVAGPQERLLTPAKSIDSYRKFVAVASEHELLVAELDGKSVMGPVRNESPIRQILILNENVMIILQNNGRLMGRETHHGDILKEINLEEMFDSLMSIGDRLYCKNKAGTVKLFEFINTLELTQLLKKHKISVTEGEMEKDPTAPVRDCRDFYNREQILKEIKDKPKASFLITGAAKSGKTSLLHILNDVLAANSRCCYLDIEKINKEATCYEEFETNIFAQCLSQHGIPPVISKKSLVFQELSSIVNKIRGRKKYCVFCMDNFIQPEFINVSGYKKFNQLIKEMCIHEHVRLIFTCVKSKQKENEQYFNEIRSIKAMDKKNCHLDLLPFDEVNAKSAIRQVVSLSSQFIGEIYRYTGGFPHLIQLYRGWNPEKIDIEAFSERIANEHKEKIFAYFRDLNSNARLILATLLNKNLTSKKIHFEKIYTDFPLLEEFVSRDKFKDTLKEIVEYSDEFKVTYDENRFNFEIKDNPKLFYLASRHIPRIAVLFSLYQFSQNPTIKNAHEIVLAIRNLLHIQIEDERRSSDSLFELLIERFKHQFYIRKMSTEALNALRIPLITFVVIPLNPWLKGDTIQYFSSLYASLQEYVRRSERSEGMEAAAVKFYITLFSFRGISFPDLKEEMIGLERISIIDSQKMKDILLAESPLEKTRGILFQQLKISERSPYIHSGPVEDIFYGRDIEIALVRGLPENIGIFGSRTIGKTSLMLKLYRDLKDLEDWQVFAVDCGRIDSERKLLTNLAEKMGTPFRDISNIRKFRKYITNEAEQNRAKFLFLFDEVDGLIRYDVRHGEKIFRTFNILCTEPLKSRGTAARFVLFGFEEMYNQMKNPKSRLFNFMVFLPLQALNPNSALALVTHPIENIYVKWQNMDDARYLVEECSGHPWLLQAACNTLLKVLDQKSSKGFDIVEKENVEKALLDDDFRQLCMRPYESITRYVKDPFFQGIHKMTTLAALILYTEDGKELFSLNDIRMELKKCGLDILPDRMHTIISNLCMYGIFRYMGDPDIIMKKEKKREARVSEGVQKAKKLIRETEALKVDTPEKIIVTQPEIFDNSKQYNLEFKYQFAVKIFPRILEANLGGLENCKIEIKETVKRKR